MENLIEKIKDVTAVEIMVTSLIKQFQDQDEMDKFVELINIYIDYLIVKRNKNK